MRSQLTLQALDGHNVIRMTKHPCKPQELDFESAPTVQTIFEVRNGGSVATRTIHLIAPAVHLLLRIVAGGLARANRATERRRR